MARAVGTHVSTATITDLHLTEAGGYFYFFAWIQAAVGGRCVVGPEFPARRRAMS